MTSFMSESSFVHTITTLAETGFQALVPLKDICESEALQIWGIATLNDESFMGRLRLPTPWVLRSYRVANMSQVMR